MCAIDRKNVLAELENIQVFFEARADMSIGGGKIRLLEYANAVRDARELLKEQEAVVRCKDCKHGREPILAHRKGYVWCERVNQHNDADWFCADGERR